MVDTHNYVDGLMVERIGIGRWWAGGFCVGGVSFIRRTCLNRLLRACVCRMCSKHPQLPPSLVRHHHSWDSWLLWRGPHHACYVMRRVINAAATAAAACVAYRVCQSFWYGLIIKQRRHPKPSASRCDERFLLAYVLNCRFTTPIQKTDPPSQQIARSTRADATSRQ